MISKSALLRLLRESLGKNQEEVATKVGITTNYLSLIENNKKNPSPELVKLLAKEYKVPATLFAWEEEDFTSDISGEEKIILKELSLLIEKLFSIAVTKNAKQGFKFSK